MNRKQRKKFDNILKTISLAIELFQYFTFKYIIV